MLLLKTATVVSSRMKSRTEAHPEAAVASVALSWNTLSVQLRVSDCRSSRSDRVRQLSSDTAWARFQTAARLFRRRPDYLKCLNFPALHPPPLYLIMCHPCSALRPLYRRGPFISLSFSTTFLLFNPNMQNGPTKWSPSGLTNRVFFRTHQREPCIGFDFYIKFFAKKPP